VEDDDLNGRYFLFIDRKSDSSIPTTGLTACIHGVLGVTSIASVAHSTALGSYDGNLTEIAQ